MVELAGDHLARPGAARSASPWPRAGWSPPRPTRWAGSSTSPWSAPAASSRRPACVGQDRASDVALVQVPEDVPGRPLRRRQRGSDGRRLHADPAPWHRPGRARCPAATAVGTPLTRPGQRHARHHLGRGADRQRCRRRRPRPASPSRLGRPRPGILYDPGSPARRLRRTPTARRARRPPPTPTRRPLLTRHLPPDPARARRGRRPPLPGPSRPRLARRGRAPTSPPVPGARMAAVEPAARPPATWPPARSSSPWTPRPCAPWPSCGPASTCSPRAPPSPSRSRACPGAGTKVVDVTLGRSS